MPSQSFYRKWRSQSFAEIVGQEHVTRTLLNALSLGRISHAYLFCGPRGVGKTSTARVLAKAVNCLTNGHGEPCNECEICQAITQNRCLDVIELDAASNRGIDQIRDLREKVNLSPSQARFKFYILDEAHMLTSEAANALLKTLEEPPAHVIFILATTEAHQLPATILSRCQRHDFRRVPLPVLVDRLRTVAEGEGLEVEHSALEMIGRAATGSLRDAESLLDQLVAYSGSRFGAAEVRAALGSGDTETVRELSRFILEQRLSDGLRLINQVVGEGDDLRQFCREVVEYLRNVMLLQLTGDRHGLIDATAEDLEEMRRLAEAVSSERTVRAIRAFGQAETALRNTAHPQLPLEMAMVEVSAEYASAPAVASASAPRAGQAAERPRPHLAPVATDPPKSTGDARPIVSERPRTPPPPADRLGTVAPVGRPELEPARETSAAAASAETPISEPAQLPSSPAVMEQDWRRVLDAMGAVNKRVQALLRSSKPLGFEGETLVLAFAYPFHQQCIEEIKTRSVVEKVAGDVFGKKCMLRCTLLAEAEKQQSEAPVDDPLVKFAVGHGARIKKVDVQPGEEPVEGT